LTDKPPIDHNDPTPASFDEVNKIFHALDNALADYVKDNIDKVNPYEVYLALKCLEYKFDTHQMNAYFSQTMQEIMKREQSIDDKKDQPQYR